jgi:DNA-binding YbaB/EbfC family protein
MNTNLIKQMQQKLLKAQEELGNELVTVTAGGGAVTIVMTGHQMAQSITIAPEALDPNDVEMLQDLMLTAVNDAIAKSQELATKRLGAVTGGLKIPGLM